MKFKMISEEDVKTIRMAKKPKQLCSMKAAYARHRPGYLMVVMSEPWDQDGNLTNFSQEGHSACSREYVAECTEPNQDGKAMLDKLLASGGYRHEDLEFISLSDFKHKFCS